MHLTASAGQIPALLLGALACSGLATPLAAQVAPPSSYTLPLVRDTGWVANTASSPEVVASFLVSVPGAASLRLRFSEIALGESPLPGCASKLRMVSVLDGGTQELDARHCQEWSNSSCYFNGDSVEVEIVAAPGSGSSHAVLSEVVVGTTPQALTLCGPTDDRVLSADPRIARVLPTGCTAWIVSDCTHCFLTAGHCAAGLGVLEFNVPLSTATGDLQHPGPEDQYALDPSSLQYLNGGQGNDWAYFGCFRNPVTGQSPYERQGASFVLATTPPANDGTVAVRVTGYGVDSAIPEYNQVQQTALGPYGNPIGNSIIQYAVDTTGGNSGSPVIWDNTGLVIGIHTNGGCWASEFGFNGGTGVQNQNLRNALLHPQGVCAAPCSASVVTFCTQPDDPSSCHPEISSTGSPSQTGGAGSFWINAHDVASHKTGLLLYGFAPGSVPFVGATLCVAAPFVRTAAQDSQGTVDVNDCSGSYAFDMGSYIALGTDPALAAGTVAYAQYWARDPSSPPTNFRLSDALQFIIGP
jgi:hypothetical protein